MPREMGLNFALTQGPFGRRKQNGHVLNFHSRLRDECLQGQGIDLSYKDSVRRPLFEREECLKLADGLEHIA